MSTCNCCGQIIFTDLKNPHSCDPVVLLSCPDVRNCISSLGKGLIYSNGTTLFSLTTPVDGAYCIQFTNGIPSIGNCGGGGSGTVTSVDAGNLNPLFTTVVNTATTTPSIVFSQISQNQNLVFASPDGSAGNPVFRSIVVNDISNPADITSGDGSVILGGTPVGSVLKAVDLTVNPATIIATIAQPDTQIVFGTGTSISSSPLFTYNQNGSPNTILQMIDPNSGNPVFYVETNNGVGGSAQFVMIADNFFTTGAYAALQCDTSGIFTMQSQFAGKTVGLIITPIDSPSLVHGVQILVDSANKAQFETDSFNLRKAGDPAVDTYQLRFYELFINGSNYVGFKSPLSLAGDVMWTLPTTDSTGTQALVSDGAGTLSWASVGAGSVTSVSGTANRITSTGGTTPVIDISASYVGQTSITTLGTVTTGTWTATKIGTAYGGTNADSSASTGVAQVSAGTWSWSTALANGTTATTQAANDNSTKVATTAYADAIVSGYVPTSRTLTINGSAQTLAADRTWTITTTGTTGNIAVSGGGGLTPTIDLIATAVTAATYTVNGSNLFTVDAYGRLTSASNITVTAVASSIVVGTTTITSGTNLRILYDNSGVVGEIAVGTANQVLGVTNAGTGYEYKTLSTSGTAVSNDVGVTLSTANSLIINLPSASASVRGVLTSTDWSTFNSKISGLVIGTTTITSGANTRVLYDNSGVLGEYTVTGTAGNVVLSGTPTIATPSFTTGFTIGGAASSGLFIVGNGTNFVASTSTIPTSAGATANKVLLSDGTNYVLSTPTFPNASATTRKIIVSDGTNWIASTETYATPSTSGNVLTSDGTNWTSAAPVSGAITVGTTAISSGTGTRLVYETSGNKFGEISGVTSDGTSVTFGSANLLATRPKITTSIDDANGNAMIAFSATSSAVDTFTITNAATANPATVKFQATGSDSNINALISPKGTGRFQISDGTDLTKILAFNLSGATTAITGTWVWSPTTAKTLTFPNVTDTIAVLGTAQSFTATLTTAALTSISGVYSTGGQIIAGISQGTTATNYRTTNGGSNVGALLYALTSTSSSGSLGFAFDTTNSFSFTAGNGTRQIARAGIAITNLTNTAGSEAGDIAFYTQTGGSAMAVRVTISSATITFIDAYDIVLGSTTGTKIGTATGQKIGFYGVTPVAQQVLATGALKVVDDVITFLQTIGLCKQS